MKAIIVDDEKPAQNILHNLLTEYCPDVTVVETCSNIPKAVIAINQYQPDVVFLDIDMPGYNGFQLLDFFKDISFEIIFVTAYSEYAIQAFRVSALDFLQKPIDIDLLINAVKKLKKNKENSAINEQLEVLRENIQAASVKKIALPVSDGIIFIKVDDILYLEADKAYTIIVMTDKRKIVASKNIKEFEETLKDNKNFFRSHRSYIVNLNFVSKYLKSDGSIIEMTDKSQIALSKELKEVFIGLMKNTN